jgi:hypothetical protein
MKAFSVSGLQDIFLDNVSKLMYFFVVQTIVVQTIVVLQLLITKLVSSC